MEQVEPFRGPCTPCPVTVYVSHITPCPRAHQSQSEAPYNVQLLMGPLTGAPEAEDPSSEVQYSCMQGGVGGQEGTGIHRG